jgi:Phytanoyl-CoA dioxygenase (PhyH)
VALTLTPEQRDEFSRRGVLRLEGLLSAQSVERARSVVLAQLEQLGLWKDGAWRLQDWPRPEYPQKGLKTSKVIGNKRPEFEALLDEPALRAAVDGLLQGRPCDRSMHPRPQLLFTLPNIDRWVLPPGWHVDAPRLASGEWPGVQMFACLDHVAPRGGGTLVIAGSHKLLNDGRHIRARDLHRLLGPEDFFRRIWGKRPINVADDDALPRGAVDNVALEVMELTGAPGDTWLTDLRVLHSGAPNAGDRPRMMVTHRFIRADLVGEIAQAYGWR